MAGATQISRWRAWGMAIRPQTLPAGIAPVLVGVAAAYADGVFAPLPALAAFVGAILIQIGANLANDYYDAMKGVDTADREGFTRVTQAGLIPPKRVFVGMVGTFLAAVVIGLYLVYLGGVPILVIGVLSIICGIAYAGGPIPYGSYGLGDLFVFVFFGLVAVTGTYYVQAVAAMDAVLPVGIPMGALTGDVVVMSVAMGCLTTAILVVNNLRDIETDAEAGKRTLAVIVGRRYARLEYGLLLGVAYLVPFVLLSRGWGVGVLAPVLSIPLALVIGETVVRTTDATRLNRALERTGQLLMAYAVLFAIGVIVG